VYVLSGDPGESTELQSLPSPPHGKVVGEANPSAREAAAAFADEGGCIAADGRAAETDFCGGHAKVLLVDGKSQISDDFATSGFAASIRGLDVQGLPIPIGLSVLSASPKPSFGTAHILSGLPFLSLSFFIRLSVLVLFRDLSPPRGSAESKTGLFGI
jgi:hypothetical protein